MELVEKIPILKINYLNSLSYNDFKPYCKKSCKNEEDRKKQYNIMKHFCETNLKTRGETKRIYAYTLTTPLEVGGRLYCGNSIQGLSSKIRGFLLGDTTTDIDMRNAHPTILEWLCIKHDIKCPNLTYYINNRDKLLIDYGKDFKTEFLKCVNDSNKNKKMKDKFCKDFDNECKEIQQKITALNDYAPIVATVPDTKIYNWYGSAINRILCVFENKILQEVISFVNSKQIEIAVLMFDGMMVYGNYYNDDNFIRELEEFVNSKFDNLNMKFAFKEHDTESITMPLDFTLEKVEKKQLEKSFEEVATEFEKNHAKIINRSVFIKTTDNDNIIMSKQMVKNSYENLIYYYEDKEGEVKTKNFINHWLVDNPKQRCYDDIAVYPNDKLCPPTHYNMWRKFPMELVEKYETKPVERDFILNHIKILCDHNLIVYDYLIKWIGQMVQFPETKTTCPTFISQEGAGKGSLIRLFEKMLGDCKVFETTKPSRDVWGDFNGRMANTFLIILNELSKKETLEAEGYIKGLITDPKITINNKGTNQYDINSYHRFIICTNKEEPCNTNKDDRRKWFVRCSDELIGNTEYFNKYYQYLNDINVVKTVFEYFKSISDLDNFNKNPLPVTEYHKGLMEYSKCPIERWLEAFTLENQNRDFIELKAESILEKFNEWCAENGIDYKVDSLKLAVRMSRLKIEGVEKTRTNVSKLTKFDIDKMKTHFKIGCLL
jgi:hypothetical protein